MDTDEELETGYGRATPAGDNLLNDFARGEADAFASLAEARGDRVDDRDELSMMLADGRSPSPFGNVVVLRRPVPDARWPHAARSMREFFRAAPGGPFMVFSAWPTPDLTPFELGLVGHPPMMFRFSAPIAPHALEGLETRAVADAATARDFEDVMVHGYPLPELEPFRPGCLLPPRALAAKGWEHWVGYLGGRPVGTSSAYSDGTHVHVEFISTLPAARGSGIGRAMTAIATGAHATLPALLIASDLGRPVYDRLGYRSLLRYTLWVGRR